MTEPVAAPQRGLRSMRSDDLAQVAALHRSELSYGLFPRLGERFLRTYHAALLDSPEAVNLVVCDDEGLAGFLVGSLDQHRNQHWILRHRGLRLAAAGTAGLLLHPQALRLFVRTRLRRYLRRLQRALPSSDPTTYRDVTRGQLGVLLHVAVAVDRRGEGLGRLMTERFASHAVDRGVDELQLVTANSSAAAFYRRLGWDERQARTDPDGTVVTTFGYQLQGRALGGTSDGSGDG